MKHETVSQSGRACTKTVQGYFKPTFICLTNQELYLYSDKDSEKHREMYVLAPGVFIRPYSPPVEEPRSMGAVGQNELVRYYPIEIILGGHLSSSSARHQLTLFFTTQDDHTKWLKQLLRATGSYFISDFYQLDFSSSAGHPMMAVWEQKDKAGRVMQLPDAQAKIEDLQPPERGSILVHGLNKVTK